MKVRYRIAAAFTLLTILVLFAICAFIFLKTADQNQKDFTLRLKNRALTVASVLFKYSGNDYQLLSKLDSATTNLNVSECINVYNNRNQRIYRFARNSADTLNIRTELLNEIRVKEYVATSLSEKQVVGIYYQNSDLPVVVVISAIDENGSNNLTELRQSLGFAFIAGTLLSLLTGFLFSRQLVKPIEQITGAVNEISSTNIEKRLPEPGVKDEWHKLAVTFNNLLSRLQESFEIQGRFISNASHEISTPLTSVINQIDVVLRKERSNEEYLTVLRSVQSDLSHMSALTQQLLNIARTSRGGAIQTEAIRVDEILMEIPSLVKKINPDYKVNTFFDELPDNENLCMVNGNQELLLSAFKNMAENGCKYSQDATVNISLSFIETRIIVLFVNNCESFDPREIEHIFQPFQRGSNVSGQSGYGLGLSLSRRIILLHRGEIKAELAENGQILISVILPSEA